MLNPHNVLTPCDGLHEMKFCKMAHKVYTSNAMHRSAELNARLFEKLPLSMR